MGAQIPLIIAVWWLLVIAAGVWGSLRVLRRHRAASLQQSEGRITSAASPSSATGSPAAPPVEGSS